MGEFNFEPSRQEPGGLPVTLDLNGSVQGRVLSLCGSPCKNQQGPYFRIGMLCLTDRRVCFSGY
jgi:hypothetical protein